MKPPRAPPPICKITMQYRSGAGKVYELESAGKMLDVHVTPREAPKNVDEWEVAVHDRRGADAIVVAESGATRVEALGKVSRAWTERGLSAFDWDAIATTLLAVRGI